MSTVTTESDFTTVEATSNGYFEDVKLEGKTLVNICPKPKASVGDGNHLNNVIISDNVVEITAEEGRYTGVNFTQNSPHMKPNTTYTIVANILENTMTKGSIAIIEANPDTSFTGTSIPLGYKGLFVQKTTTRSVYTLPRIQSMTTTTCKTGEKIKFSLMVLEGDHTQNPPSYFEGLASVGDGVDEIVVSSCNENLFDINKHNLKQEGDYYYTTTYYKDAEPVIYQLKPYTDYMLTFKRNSAHINFEINGTDGYDANNAIYTKVFNSGSSGKVTLRLGSTSYSNIGTAYGYDFQLKENAVSTEYTPHISDKKRLLYYNEKTQSWEKPVLREWDSIEKHADGKYYYHQRSGEVVLNGSENWRFQTDFVAQNNTIGFSVTGFGDGNTTTGLSDTICNRFNAYNQNKLHNSDIEGITQGYSALYVRITRAKLSSQDVQGFKQWLQTNNVTVVYKLAKEKVYECTNIDLLTYANETNYVVESGAIVPKTTLKVHNNISNVVRLLQEKVSLLENKFIMGLKQVLAGDMYSLATLLYPEDFVSEEEPNDVPTLLI